MTFDSRDEVEAPLPASAALLASTAIEIFGFKGRS